MESKPDEFDAFQEKTSEILEGFLESMQNDPRFTGPVQEGDFAEEHWTFVYTDRAMRLIERLRSRISRLCVRKFGESGGFDLDLESHLYQEY